MSVIQIDDQDPSVKYFGHWRAGGSDKDYKGTLSSSTHVGAGFTVPFNGTSITVYGTLDSPSQGVVASYSVDEAIPAQLTFGSAAGDVDQTEFWESPQLSSGSHTLKVTMVQVNNVPDQPTEGTVWFDWFGVENVVDTTIASQIPTTTVTTSIITSITANITKPSANNLNDSTTSRSKLTTLISNTTTSLSTTTTSLSASQTSSANATNVISTTASQTNKDSDRKSSANTSVIVASSIAGALFLALLISGLLLWQRRRQIGTAPQVEPYSTDSTSALLSEAATPTQSQITLGTAAATSPQYTQHVDSEVRQLDVELPPTYSTLPALVNRRNGRTNKS